MASLPPADVRGFPAPRGALAATRSPAAGTRYELPVAQGASARLAAGWLALGVAALVGSGLFSLLLVLARTPGLKDLFPVANFFQVALVAHVDLSVLVWFLAFAGVLWSLAGDSRAIGLGRAALALCAAGTAAITVAPLAGNAVPVLANYIPVIDNAVFLGGLGALGAGVALAIARTFLATRTSSSAPGGADALRWGIVGSAIATAMALAAFGWSWMEVSPHLERKAYFELLFWGGGHVLQFTWTLLMLVAWLWLAGALGLRPALSPRVTLIVFTIALASVFVTPAIYLAHPVASVEHHKLQTWLMRFGGGLAIPPILLALLFSMRRLPALDAESRPLFGALAASIGALRGRRAHRLRDQRPEREDPRALPRLHRGRDARLHGARLPPPAAAGLQRAALAPGRLAAVALRRRPARAHRGPRVVRAATAWSARWRARPRSCARRRKWRAWPSWGWAGWLRSWAASPSWSW